MEMMTLNMGMMRGEETKRETETAYTLGIIISFLARGFL